MRLKRHGFSRTDWVGDGIVTVMLGLAVLAGVFLPWANYSTGHDVNLSAHSSPGINGALATQWGLPVLGLAALVVVVGVAMIVSRPLKLSVPALSRRQPRRRGYHHGVLFGRLAYL